MKKISSVWKLLLVSTFFVFALTSCEYLPFCSHRDENDDSLCDKCGEEYTDGKDVFEHVCTEAEREENRVEGNCKSGGSYDLVKYCKECEKIISVTKVTLESPAHKKSDWIVDTAPSCEKEGLRVKICIFCAKDLEIESIPKTEHNYDANGICTLCGAKDSANNENPAYSVGLEYTISNDGKYYILDGIGTCKDTEIIIPQTYNGLPVEAIGERAFENCLNITKVVIPDGVKRIGEIGSGATRSFRNCENLTEIVIPDSVYYIGSMAGESAFYGCKELWSYENGVYYVNDWALTYQGWCTGASNTHDTHESLLEIRDGTIGIGNQAFIRGSYTEVVIPISVKYVCQVAFWWWNNAERVYYIGAEEQWSKILIDESNDGITDHPVYCYSETQPTTEGNFWHYVNGVPTVWDVSNPEEHSHTFRLTDMILTPSCVRAGYMVVSCTCGVSKIEMIPATSPTLTHSSVGGCCGFVGETPPNPSTYSQGLVFVTNNNGSCYVYGDLSFNSEHLIVPGISPDGETVTAIRPLGFSCFQMKSVVLRWGVSVINVSAFSGCSALETVVLPVTIARIDDDAFANCTNLTHIFYEGSSLEWQRIDFNDKNTNMDSLPIYFYSSSAPTTEGNFWHYVDGVPTVW